MSERKPYSSSTRVFINILLVCAFLFFNLIVRAPIAGADDAGLSVDFRDNLISIHANDVNFKEILMTLKSKTGVNVVIFQRVPDHKVSLDIQSLPLYALDTIIKKMALKNSAPFPSRNGREEKLSLCVAFMKADKGTLKMDNELSMLSSELTRNSLSRMKIRPLAYHQRPPEFKALKMHVQKTEP